MAIRHLQKFRYGKNQTHILLADVAKNAYFYIKDIPFPSVTICNMNQVKKSFKETLTKERDMIFLDSLCTRGDQLNNDTEKFEGKWTYVREFLLNASQVRL